MNLKHFRASLRNRNHRFADTLAFIAANYDYTPSRFINGAVENAAGENEGSCKTLGLALLEQFTTEEALLAFGEHYQSVLANPRRPPQHPRTDGYRSAGRALRCRAADPQVSLARDGLRRAAV